MADTHEYFESLSKKKKDTGTKVCREKKRKIRRRKVREDEEIKEVELRDYEELYTGRKNDIKKLGRV